MFDNTNHYTLKILRAEETVTYHAVFEDGEGKTVEAEITREIAKSIFLDFVRIERNLKRSDERRLEHSEQTEQSLEHKMLHKPLTVEEEVFRKMDYVRLHKAIEKLPPKQRRRIKLYYFENLNLREIARLEQCSFQTVARGIKKAERTLKKLF